LWYFCRFLLHDLISTGGRPEKQSINKMSSNIIESSAFLSAIVESSDDAIIGKSLDGTILSWNGGAEHLYQYSAEEAVGRSISLIIPPERDGELERILERIGRGERVHRLETVRVRKDGTRLEVSITISPIKDGSGQTVGASAIARDITRQKLLEQERAALREEVIRAQELLLAELSTPLIPIKEGIVVLPLIGAMTEKRAGQMLSALLEGITARCPHTAIIDITGVSTVDTQVASALVNAAAAVKLMGTEVVITGIRGRVAQTLIGLGVDLGGIVTRRNLQGGIDYAERSR
jgi:PAS domain S-box-containing protein